MDTVCALAGDTKVETPEGALTIKGLAGKATPVFTREDGRVRFRMMLNVRQIATAQPVVRVTLETGAGFRVAPSQILFKKDASEVRADQLQAGDELVPTFHYPEGYEFVDDVSTQKLAATPSVRVTSVTPAGEADLYSFAVNQAGCFFVSAGVLCKAEAASG